MGLRQLNGKEIISCKESLELWNTKNEDVGDWRNLPLLNAENCR
jgi:hypothetical protein